MLDNLLSYGCVRWLANVASSHMWLNISVNNFLSINLVTQSTALYTPELILFSMISPKYSLKLCVNSIDGVDWIILFLICE